MPSRSKTSACASRYPDIVLELSSHERVVDLIENRVDLAIRVGALQDSTLRARPLGSSRRRLLASPGYLETHGVPTSIDAWLRHRLIGFSAPEQLNDWPLRDPKRAGDLNDVVKAGKARYIGASSMYAWQFAKALHVSKANGWTRFVTMQNHLNLLYREEQREMLPLCVDEGIGVIPWSPLARGRLTRDWNDSSQREQSDSYGKKLYGTTADADKRVVEAVAAVAAARGIPRAQAALAWVMGTPGVSAPIVGASKPNHLDDAIAALAVKLTAEERQALEAPYVPHAVAGLA